MKSRLLLTKQELEDFLEANGDFRDRFWERWGMASDVPDLAEMENGDIYIEPSGIMGLLQMIRDTKLKGEEAA